jgi:2-polyprenyl-3-methyl-5-hydroxy-6-metoxy-1,4-benzoquinol methylase
MQETISNPAIIQFLKEQYPSTGFIDGLKIRYRSLICPFINLIGLVKPGEKVGDVGCGSGQFLLLLSRFAQPSFLYGIEIAQRLIDNANALFSPQPASGYGFSTYDGIHFPEKLRDMDRIFLIDVLHHVPKQQQAVFIRDLCAVLKPGAELVLKDIDASSPFVYFNKVHDLIFAREIGNELSMQTAFNLLQQEGLQITAQDKRRMYVYPHYTIIAKK